MQQQHCAHKGFITLISVLLVGAIGVVVALSLILIGLGNTKTSLVLLQSNQAKALANACAEEGLQQIRTLTSYTGTGNLSMGSGTCSYTVSGEPPTKTVVASGTVGTVIRKVSITTSAVSPKIIISSWQEVAN